MSVRILIGDVREKLRELADESVHCCVTSPPYFGLRDYGVDRLNRSAILVELNPAYAAMAQKRIEGDAGMFAKVSAA